MPQSSRRNRRAKANDAGRPVGRADHARIAAMTDAEIARRSPRDLTVLPEDFWDDAVVVAPRKAPISIRLDADVLAWFRAQGRGYQRRMNAVLRQYATSHGMS